MIPRNGIVYTISSLMFIKQVKFFVMISYLFFLSISHQLNGFYSCRFTVQGHLNFFRVVKVIILACNMLFHRRKRSIWHQYQWKKKIKAIYTFKIHSFHCSSARTHPPVAYLEWKKFGKNPILLLNSLIESSSLGRNIEIASFSHSVLLKGVVN